MSKRGRKEIWPYVGAWLLLLLIAGYLQAAGTGLDITFKGTLIDRQCVFEQDDMPLEVIFPPKGIRFFKTYIRTETMPFTLGLKNCTAATQGKTVDLTFSYPQTETVDGVAMLKPTGDTGLVIVLLDGAGNMIEQNKTVDVGSITQTGSGKINRFTLGAYVMAPSGVTVKEGKYSATATFMVSYR
ncbi:type 1 fimbrial protein [Salmonella enterica subsp. houtenae serovar 44:z36,[z38]:-]|uniref:Type 1 fimbrial protein n=1 Tax=Salmonella enterica subsp. houtenae serovar 44:z36[z38]:- TaxID=1967609 RepID=A0A736MFH8_SALHO|nr:type 1 fimbrial protein [Salmonella enterica]ECZ5471654.1 type 1 fimbrial protein [Salmonella enterica subsp. houtenae]EDP9793965.1 type 1 fimbrial protein [Salmonella enterica subsp. salamae]EHM8759225.1 type 1 fimbrial protein [Salmonella enterica subsp. houtenae serovar 44:z36,[z38]:-]HAE7581341.1 type 1 fimbrial protein [Salmonella enterica subsp. houtenae serovar 44:z36[z38]:-]HCM6269243.1 type 1 fimbrial protein [Salmonella enterica subsp. houtenae serovar 44:z36,Z38:-]